MAARAFPMVMPRPKLTDEAPLMTPVEAAIGPPPPVTPWPMTAFAASLLAGAGVTLVGGGWHLSRAPRVAAARARGPRP